MRQDQYERLQALEEKLLDSFLEEAEPAEWPGHGIKIAAMDAATRGDRYWCKKNAAATGMLATRVVAMIGATQAFGAGTTPPASDDAHDHEQQLDAEIASAEREAAKLLDELQRGGKKRAFDRKVHGS
jgi:hypothetical protein